MNYRTLAAAGGAVGAAIFLSARVRARRDRVNSAERCLDEAIEQTFPASDPTGNTVETGVAVRADPYRDL